MSYSHMGTPTLPSALLHFTSEFGMGSGGATVLLSLDKNFYLLNFVLTLLLQSRECSLRSLNCASLSFAAYSGLIYLRKRN